MENLSGGFEKEVDALFLESDLRYFALWHRIASCVISVYEETEDESE